MLSRAERDVPPRGSVGTDKTSEWTNKNDILTFLEDSDSTLELAAERQSTRAGIRQIFVSKRG